MATHPKSYGTTPTTESEPVLNEQQQDEGYGIVGGRPLGINPQKSRRGTAQRFKFIPGARATLLAATNRALGRR